MRSIRNLEVGLALAALVGAASHTEQFPVLRSRQSVRHSKPADLGELVKIRRAKNKAAKKSRVKNRSR